MNYKICQNNCLVVFLFFKSAPRMIFSQSNLNCFEDVCLAGGGREGGGADCGYSPRHSGKHFPRPQPSNQVTLFFVQIQSWQNRILWKCCYIRQYSENIFLVEFSFTCLLVFFANVKIMLFTVYIFIFS